MIYHPVLLGVKLILLVVFVLVLVALHRVLGPGQFLAAVIIASAVFVVLVVVLWVVTFKLLGRPGSKLGRQVILSAESRAEDGYVASSGEFASMVGERGVALSALRPSGTALFGQKRAAVVTEGDFLPKGSEVEIVSVSGSRVVVRGTRPPGDST
ncbi:MAG TPA: NfeD family protein [Planctomycetota bacterium]|nr:NfeD family protein [Planctomycetota bacterium]